MTTLREKRHRQCLNTIGRLTEQRELAFRRLALIQSRLHDERLRLRRLQKELGKKPIFTPMPEAPAWIPKDEPGPLPTLYTEAEKAKLTFDYPEPDLTIPDFLKRDAKDKAARAEIEAHRSEVKGVKTKARIDRLKAAQRGDLRKMPLSGKAALKAIREG
jgi:hypothetical protein